jgi:hypothetical protein
MKLFVKPARLFFLITLLVYQASVAQDFSDPVQYMDYIGKANTALTEKYLVYLSGMSHGKSARKVEKRRLEVVEAINNTRYTVVGMPPFKGDRTLRDTTVAYLKLLNNVFNEDYGKIVNLEDIAEQSYDAMEAYMLAKDKANEKLMQASAKQYEMQEKFAAAHNIKLIKSESETDAKMKTAGDVLKYYNDVYLIFFKSYKQEAYLMDAVNGKSINAIEQNINSLQTFSEEGLAKLKEVKAYNNDASLTVACRNLMNFYQGEAKKGATITEYFLKEENFVKLKKQFDASKRTEKEVNQFNKAVNDINTAGNVYNANNASLNKERSSSLDDWNKAVKRYMDTYIPYQQR